MLILIFSVLSVILIHRVFVLQIVNGQEYYDDYKLLIQKTRKVQGTRGAIYDRNGKLLAYNELAYTISIEDIGEYKDTATKNAALNKVISDVIYLVESNDDTVIHDFGIILDKNNEYTFTSTNSTERLRFVADVYGKLKIDDLSTEQQNQSADEIIDYLCTNKTYGYGIDQSAYEKSEVLKLVNIRYAISLNSFQKYITTPIAKDVSTETVAAVMENLDSLTGVSIEEDSLRRYVDAKYFSSILGYTGQISLEEYNALSPEDQEVYSKLDTVGKAGIEKSMDSVLQGEHGEVKVYVNNVGKVIETSKGKDAGAGNDIYLTIDADLQIAAYKILEQELAGILLKKMTPELEFDRTSLDDGSKVLISAGDLYHAFFANDIIDTSHFSSEEAGSVEKTTERTFNNKKALILRQLRNIFENEDAAAYKDSEKDIQAYLTFIVSTWLTSTNKVIMGEKIDTTDPTYLAWKTDETLNPYTYLHYAISQNWVDTTKLIDFADKNEYTSSDEIYDALVEYVFENMEKTADFDKLIYKYMIRSEEITGTDVCLLLYEQGILPYDQSAIDNLKSGATSAYDLLRYYIYNLTLTPGQLGLEPCTGSVVVTDTKTGGVLACVSYPGYDNNRLANTMDSSYYNQLVMSQSKPLYNNATQEKTAPGSTFKPITAFAGLMEGVIAIDTPLSCHGIYKKVYPNPKCWIWPGAHGGETVRTALRDSCNAFFFEVGYRLSLSSQGLEQIVNDNDEGDATGSFYFSVTGTDKMQKYAELFGLGDVSGMEIPETKPQISDTSSVPSAIGQGDHNYTTSQLARYITAVANEGTVFDLSLIKKTVDSEGELVEENEPNIKNKIEDVDPAFWEEIHLGLHDVITSRPTIFASINQDVLPIAGKTGTAQQSTSHPDHALFIGYAPSTEPEIAFAVRITNGYTSTYAAEVGRDVLRYHYNLETPEHLLTGTASSVGAQAVED
jgi:penicillin-binding protein 2